MGCINLDEHPRAGSDLGSVFLFAVPVCTHGLCLGVAALLSTSSKIQPKTSHIFISSSMDAACELWQEFGRKKAVSS